MITDDAKHLLKAANRKYTFQEVAILQIIYIAEAARLLDRCPEIRAQHLAEAVQYATWTNDGEFPFFQLETVTCVTERVTGDKAQIAKRATILLTLARVLQDEWPLNEEFVKTMLA